MSFTLILNFFFGFLVEKTMKTFLLRIHKAEATVKDRKETFMKGVFGVAKDELIVLECWEERKMKIVIQYHSNGKVMNTWIIV